MQSKTIEQNVALKTHPSPYLRSHADDPIHWQIIAKETLQKAKANKQLIFISSGYQSCYWCYRMKQDTFNSNKLARLINSSFIPVLIDREMETGIDQQLQQFMQEQRGFGGWPLTVVLTPQGYPVIGFTYIREASLSDALKKLLSEWKTDPEKIIELAETAAIAREKKHEQQGQLLKNPDYQKLLLEFLQQVSATADDNHGGFGDKEKFPNIAQLNALLDIYGLNPDPSLSKFLQLTLDNMLAGAIRDQLSGGFFRYAGNRDWSNPHYEQMLYTQALMGKLLIRAGQSLKNPQYVSAGEDTLVHMVNQFREKGVDKKRLYRAALSAVSDAENKQSGGYYLWTPAELEKLLGKGWQASIEDLSTQLDQGVLPKPISKDRASVTDLLLKKRNKRAQSYDDKKLLAWQGLVLSGLSYGAQLSPKLANAAKLLASELLILVEQQKMYTLMDVPEAEAGEVTLSNIVYVAQGLIDWWQVSGDDQALQSAKTLLESAHQLFYKDDRWLQENAYGILAFPPTRAIADTQLPSPSAIWLSLSWALSDLDPQSTLKAKADSIGNQLPQSLRDDAFFHATLISTIIARQWRLRNNQGSQPKSLTQKPRN